MPNEMRWIRSMSQRYLTSTFVIVPLLLLPISGRAEIVSIDLSGTWIAGGTPQGNQCSSSCPEETFSASFLVDKDLFAIVPGSMSVVASGLLGSFDYVDPAQIFSPGAGAPSTIDIPWANVQGDEIIEFNQTTFGTEFFDGLVPGAGAGLWNDLELDCNGADTICTSSFFPSDFAPPSFGSSSISAVPEPHLALALGLMFVICCVVKTARGRAPTPGIGRPTRLSR